MAAQLPTQQLPQARPDAITDDSSDESSDEAAATSHLAGRTAHRSKKSTSSRPPVASHARRAVGFGDVRLDGEIVRLVEGWDGAGDDGVPGVAVPRREPGADAR
jgi:hypothetical protein